MSAATDYAAIIREARKRHVLQDAEAVRSLDALLVRTQAELQRAIRETPRGVLGERYRKQLDASLTDALASFRAEYQAQLDSGIRNGAAGAADREKSALELLNGHKGAISAQQSLFVTEATARAEIRFGEVPLRVLERAYARVYPNGLKLSDSIHALTADAKQKVADVVVEGLATGQSAYRMARAIEPLITREGVDNLRYRAMRIARTEINTAWREGHVAAVTDEDGKLRPYVEAIGWRLSAAHPRICICDTFASDDPDGLGPGNYLPDDLPSSHPNCMCFTVSILASMPEEQWSVKAAQPDLVPKSQLEYYGFEVEE